MAEYIIVGDTDNYDGCLVKICLGSNKEQAEDILTKMLMNPTENDLTLMKGHRNLRVEAVEQKKQWWNDSFLM